MNIAVATYSTQSSVDFIPFQTDKEKFEDLPEFDEALLRKIQLKRVPNDHLEWSYLIPVEQLPKV